MNEEELKIGMYTEDEIFQYMTEQEGGMFGRSMYDAIFDKIHTQITEIEQLKKENQQLKEKLEEAEKEYDRIFGLWHNRKLIKKFDDEYDEEDKKKNPNRDYAYTMPDAEEVYKRYYDLKGRLEASEKSRKKVIYHIKNNVEDYEFENTEHYVEILDILDIDKGE